MNDSGGSNGELSTNTSTYIHKSNIDQEEHPSTCINIDANKINTSDTATAAADDITADTGILNTNMNVETETDSHSHTGTCSTNTSTTSNANPNAVTDPLNSGEGGGGTIRIMTDDTNTSTIVAIVDDKGVDADVLSVSNNSNKNSNANDHNSNSLEEDGIATPILHNHTHLQSQDQNQDNNPSLVTTTATTSIPNNDDLVNHNMLLPNLYGYQEQGSVQMHLQTQLQPQHQQQNQHQQHCVSVVPPVSSTQPRSPNNILPQQVQPPTQVINQYAQLTPQMQQYQQLPLQPQPSISSITPNTTIPISASNSPQYSSQMLNPSPNSTNTTLPLQPLLQSQPQQLQQQQPHITLSTTNIQHPPQQESNHFESILNSPKKTDEIVEKSPGGRYIRFSEKLGSGAYKNVYRAYDTIEGIEVAWNVVNLTHVSKSERQYIVNEVRLLEKLNHVNIISFHGSWVNRELEQVIFVTEILSSGTLKSFITKVQVIRWRIAKRWAKQILKGLEYLHSHDPPIVHRDLKCDNVFINGTSGDLRIGDLGLSTVISNSSRKQVSLLEVVHLIFCRLCEHCVKILYH